MRPKPHRIPNRSGHRARLRPGLLLRREPRLWWVLVLSSALAAGWLMSSVVAGAERARLAWGRSTTVLVVEHDLDAGERLGALDVRAVRWPAALVPPGALLEVPAHAVARTALVAGEVVLTARLAPAGLRGVAAALPPGSRAIAIPTEPGTAPPLAVGDRVDVLVALAPEAAGDGPPGFSVATDALVVALDEAAVTIAVQREVAPRIAVALGQGAVTLALVGA